MKKLVLSMVMAAVALGSAAATKVVAHRGYWKTGGSAQNSIAALVKADSIGCYGSEFDVWLSADGKIVVNHDPTFKGKKMEQTNFAELTAMTLANGENLPSLEQYFDAARKCTTRLILELKAHSTPEREAEAVGKIVEMVKEYGYEDRMEYISFSLNACKEFVKQAPEGTPVLYLNGELSPAELKELGISGLDYHLSVLKKHPEWIEEAHKLGMVVNSWTVDNAADMVWLIEHGVDLITTNEPVVLKQLLSGTYGEK